MATISRIAPETARRRGRGSTITQQSRMDAGRRWSSVGPGGRRTNVVGGASNRPRRTRSCRCSGPNPSSGRGP
jgi:hypothetical protein